MQPQDEELKGDDVAQNKRLANLRTKAKKFKGDGEVKHEVSTNLQLQAEEPKGDDVAPHEVPINLRWKAKEVDSVEGETEASGSARPCGQGEALAGSAS